MPDAIVPDLLERLTAVLRSGDVVYTLAQHRPNTITDIASEGVYVETDRSRKAGSGAQLVPGWMFNYAWHVLRQSGRLTNDQLVALAKRSSAVCAILARIPEIEVVSTRPITLTIART